MAQLAKQHGHKLSPAAETACMALGFGLQDQLLKLPARKKLEKLTENAAKSIHGRVLLVRLFDQTESYEVDPTSLMANLDKSEPIHAVGGQADPQRHPSG
jgi:hypothetical protein